MASIVQRGAAWRAMVRYKGVSKSRTFDTAAEAAKWATDTEGRIDRGEVAKAAPAPKPDASAAALFARYAREISPEKRGGRWEIVRLRALQLAPEFQGAAEAMDGARLAEWRDRRLRTVKASSVNRDLNLISAVFSRAIKEWRVPMRGNPVRDMMRPPQPRGRTRRVLDAERDAIVVQLGWDRVSAPTDLNEWTAWAFCFALATGMRQGEILAMRWGGVRPQCAHLPQTKNGYPRDVPLSTAALALLALLARGADGERVCKLEAGTCGAYFREAARGACVDDLHFHDARHEAATRFAARVDPMELARILGHRDLRYTMVYYHPAVEGLADKLG